MEVASIPDNMRAMTENCLGLWAWKARKRPGGCHRFAIHQHRKGLSSVRCAGLQRGSDYAASRFLRRRRHFPSRRKGGHHQTLSLLERLVEEHGHSRGAPVADICGSLHSLGIGGEAGRRHKVCCRPYSLGAVRMWLHQIVFVLPSLRTMRVAGDELLGEWPASFSDQLGAALGVGRRRVRALGLRRLERPAVLSRCAGVLERCVFVFAVRV